MPAETAESELLRTAWSPDEMLRLFNERVLPELYPGRRLARVRAKRMTYEPGRTCEVLYELRAEEGGGDALPPMAVVSFPEGGGRGPAAAPALRLPGLGAQVELFPSDWRMPALRGAVEVARMAPLLDAVTGAVPGGSWSCRPLRYHPRMRCVLLYERAGEPTCRVVGKVFAKTKRVTEAWAKLTSLFEASRGAGHWRSPRPLHRDEHLLLMEWMAGEPMKDRLEGASHEEGRRLVRLAAEALAELHRPAGRDLELRTVEIDRAKLARRAARVAALDPGLARRIGGLLERLTGCWRDLPVPEATLIHGSASPNQFLLDGAWLSIVDLDGVRWGDPAIDVGTFMASLSKARATADALPDRFLEAYRARHTGDATLVQRARLVQCQELVNYAARSLLKRGSGRDEAPPARSPQPLLDQAAACLAALP